MIAMSDSYQNLVHAGAPLGTLQYTARTLRSANGTGIEVSGCSRCVVSFMGLQTEFPIIICNLATGTDAIIGTDVLGSVLPHTLGIKNGLLFANGGASLQLHRRDSALSGRVFTVGHSSIPPYSEAVLHCSVRTTGGRALPSSGLLEGMTLFAENTGLIVGRTLADQSEWKVPVLVANFSQETIVVTPFTEVGMITQMTAIQPLYSHRIRPKHYHVTYKIWWNRHAGIWILHRDTALPLYCRNIQIYFRYLEPLSPVTRMRWNRTSIQATWPPIHCAPRRMSPQKMKKEEECVAEMLTGGQI